MTRNEMTVRVILTASGRTDISGVGYRPEGNLTAANNESMPEAQSTEVRRLLLGAALVNNSRLDEVENQWKIQGDPTEAALLTAVCKAKIIPSTVRMLDPRRAEIAFSSERKMMSTVHKDEGSSGGLVVFTKGAPDILLGYCTHEFVADVPLP